MKIIELQTKPDFLSLIPLIRRGLPEEIRNFSEEEILSIYQDHYNRHIDHIFLLEDNSITIGWYRFSRWPRENASTTEAHLFDIAVNENFERKGFGKILLKHCKSSCKKMGFQKLYSAIEKSNASSIRLHESTGFVKEFIHENQLIYSVMIT